MAQKLHLSTDVLEEAMLVESMAQYTSRVLPMMRWVIGCKINFSYNQY